MGAVSHGAAIRLSQVFSHPRYGSVLARLNREHGEIYGLEWNAP